MLITRKFPKRIKISTLKVGQTFVEDNEVFMMCQYVGGDICCPRCDEDIDINNEIRCLAVMLSNGELYDFEPYVEVELIECEVVEV